MIHENSHLAIDQVIVHEIEDLVFLLLVDPHVIQDQLYRNQWPAQGSVLEESP